MPKAIFHNVHTLRSDLDIAQDLKKKKNWATEDCDFPTVMS